MRSAAVKSEEQLAALMLREIRDILVRLRTMVIDALSAHLDE
jgi:transposase